MMKASALFVLLLASLAYCQSQTDILIIDDFTQASANNGVVFIRNSSSLPLPLTGHSIYVASDSTHIIGRQRVIILTIQQGVNGDVLTSNVFPQDNPPDWTTSTSGTAAGVSILQYDGVDNSANLNPTGLGGVDLTVGGRGQSIHLNINSDNPTNYTVTIYTSGSAICKRVVPIPGGGDNLDYYLAYSSFSGGCNFANVGAIEVQADALNNVDSSLTKLTVYGFVSVTPSPTGTRTRTPTGAASPSNTPSSIPPSGTRTPTPTPTPTPNPSGTRTPSASPSRNCLCKCPAFTCQLIFDPDDDDNKAFYFDDDESAPKGYNNQKFLSGLHNSNLEIYFLQSSASTLCVGLIAVLLLVVMI
jgi:hypothetical protein